MIKCEIYRNDRLDIEKFIISGHANQDEYGADIVCSAVSAVVYTALGALGDLAGCNEYYDIRETEDGINAEDEYIEFSLPADIDRSRYDIAKIILESMEIGLKQIEHIYDEYVILIDRR